MEQRLVSAVITTYRREPAILKRAIDSVFDQEYPFLELIVVNDAPQFGRRRQIDALVKSYGAKIRYLVNESNLGANASRNRAVALSHGAYIAFLDDDDVWLPGKVAVSLKYFNGEIGLVYSDLILVDGARERYLAKKEFPREQLEERLLGENFVGGFSGVMVRREIFDRCGKLDENFASFQDLDLWVRMAKYCDFYHVKKALHRYYVTGDSISLNAAKKAKGTNGLLEKYRKNYKKYPQMRRLKINMEVSSYLKNGWRTQALALYRGEYGGKPKDYLRNYYCVLSGNLKYIAYKMIKYYEK